MRQVRVRYKQIKPLIGIATQTIFCMWIAILAPLICDRHGLLWFPVGTVGAHIHSESVSATRGAATRIMFSGDIVCGAFVTSAAPIMHAVQATVPEATVPEAIISEAIISEETVSEAIAPDSVSMTDSIATSIVADKHNPASDKVTVVTVSNNAANGLTPDSVRGHTPMSGSLIAVTFLVMLRPLSTASYPASYAVHHPLPDMQAPLALPIPPLEGIPRIVV